MKKIYSLLIVLLFVGSAFAQKTAVIPFTATAPEIDGFLDEVWEERFPNAEAIDVNFQAEVPTIGESKWWALYDNDNFYVMVYVEDDNHYPGWESGGNDYDYDKPEVYWDVNLGDLADGVGASANASGHYQQAAGFKEDSYDTPISAAPASVGDRAPNGVYCYTLDGEGYYYEHAVPWANMPDKNGDATTVAKIGESEIGFDITVIDQDEGVTTIRQRANWNNAGAVDEAWNKMDDAGRVTLGKPVSAKNYKNRTMSVYPNPAVDNVTINADFNKVVISNILGQEVKSIAASSKVINISDLSKGVYVIKAYKNNAYVGTAKVTKN